MPKWQDGSCMRHGMSQTSADVAGARGGHEWILIVWQVWRAGLHEGVWGCTASVASWDVSICLQWT